MGGPSLLLDSARQLTDKQLVKTISAGRQDRGMPAFRSSLSQEEILALAGYVRKLQGVDVDLALSEEFLDAVTEPEPTPEFLRGERLFFGKARCGECHTVLLKGGRTGPKLTTIHNRLNREQMYAAITDPSASIYKGYEAMEIVTRDGKTIRGWARTDMTPKGSVQLYYPPESLWTTYFYKDLKSRRRLRESLMPADLLDGLTQQEIDDLMAYLLSPKRVTRR
jgi:putative heme-binding domain-containing protein